MTMTKQIDISVIIPVYNVEEYIEDCLKSVADSIGDFSYEVLMIDDGSTDESARICLEFAESHPSFHYYHKENGGLGNTRNYGVSKATGKYITFLDSDDMVTPDMYWNMYQIAEQNHSEITSINVARFNSKSYWAESLFELLFNHLSDEPCTHISKDLNLVYDTISCNKLILREFWMEHEFQFPENMVFEDIPVTFPMHYYAKNVSVIRKVGYLWRVRDGQTQSITQTNAKIKNLNDRLKALDMICQFIHSHFTEKDEKIWNAFQLKVFKLDLLIYINQCGKLNASLAKQYMNKIVDFVQNHHMNTDLIKQLNVISQQKYNDLFAGDLEHLKKTIQYQRNGYNTADIIHEKDMYLIDTNSIITIDEKGFQNDLIDYPPKVFIDKINKSYNTIDIEAHLFFKRLEVLSQDSQQVRCYLCNMITGKRVELKTETIINPELTKNQGLIYNIDLANYKTYNYDYASFRISLPLDSSVISEGFDGMNYISVTYHNELVNGRTYLRGISQGDIQRFDKMNCIDEGILFQISFDTLGTFFLERKTLNGYILNCEAYDNNLVLHGSETKSSIYLLDSKNTKMECEWHEGKWVIRKEQIKFNEHYRLVNCLDKPIIGCTQTVLLEGKDNILVYCCDDKGLIQITKESVLGQIDSIRLSEEELELDIRILPLNNRNHNLCSYELFIDEDLTKTKNILGKANLINDNTLHIVIPFNEDSTRNFYEGNRLLQLQSLDENGGKAIPIYLQQSLETFVDYCDTLQIGLMSDSIGRAQLSFIQRWSLDERGGNNRAYVRRTLYSEYQNSPLEEKTILFESMWGGKYSCNPRYLYEYIDQNHPEYKCVWAFTDQRYPIKGNGLRVRRGSKEYYYYLATAKYLVNNVNYPTNYVKRKGQIYIETMHGTPFKSLGLDSKKDFPTKNSQWAYIRKNLLWDYLIAQGSFTKDNAFKWHRFFKTILETGYPRTDDLYRSENNIAIKEELGLPLDKKIILYAPTWRKNNVFDLKLDIEKMRQRLSGEYILLVKIHHLSAKQYDLVPDNQFVYDLTTFNPIEDLYKIADIMITDYSSVMFDYLPLNRPMIFYVYDYEDYTQRERGAYFDLAKDAPGAICYTNEEVIKSIETIDKVVQETQSRVNSFKNKYITYENDRSAQKVFELVFQKHYRSTRTIVYELIVDFFSSFLPKSILSFFEKVKVHLLALIK